jgi:hypothetical protein
MKPKLILCLALVLSGGLLGCYDIANADETIGTNQQTQTSFTIDGLSENCAKLGCYLTFESQSFSVTGKASLVQNMVTTNLSADSIPAFESILRNYLDGFVVVEDARNPKILHIIDKALAEDPDYVLNKRISLKYSGGLRPTWSKEKPFDPPVGGLMPALAPKAGRIMSSALDRSGAVLRSAFDFREPNLQLSIDATNQTVRSILTDYLPLGNKPILWRAATEKDQGEVWVLVECN